MGPLRQLLARHRGERLRLLDVGCGRADIPRALVTWARRTGIDLYVVGVDQDSEVIHHAAAASRGFPEIHIVQADAVRLPFRPGSFDYVFSSMLLHYFALDEAVALLRAWGALASRAVLVSDVERHWFPCLAIPILAKILKSDLFREGSRRTVLRGFTPEEMAWLADQAGLARPRVRRYFPFRLALVGWRDDLSPGGLPPHQS
ncbi:MAG: methyltransferase domain-containing protein [Candidatus Rokubacteria bacterium]|nr:methyltransferase domain-containing protein [Candidatus Rokubacteria bacterium]